MSVAANRVIRARNDMTDPSIQTKNAGSLEPGRAPFEVGVIESINQIDARLGTLLAAIDVRPRRSSYAVALSLSLL